MSGRKIKKQLSGFVCTDKSYPTKIQRGKQTININYFPHIQTPEYKPKLAWAFTVFFPTIVAIQSLLALTQLSSSEIKWKRTKYLD